METWLVETLESTRKSDHCDAYDDHNGDESDDDGNDDDDDNSDDDDDNDNSDDDDNDNSDDDNSEYLGKQPNLHKRGNKRF